MGKVSPVLTKHQTCGGNLIKCDISLLQQVTVQGIQVYMPIKQCVATTFQNQLHVLSASDQSSDNQHMASVWCVWG